MQLNRLAASVALLAALGAAPFEFTLPSALAAEQVEAKAGWYGQLVDADFVAKYAVLPKPDGVQIIDSRPTARKYDPGHIPTALNLPDADFDKLVDQLPKDKATLLIFYCDGFECMLSHNSAFKAEKLGYSNVKVYAAGYPDWLKNGHIGAVSVPFLKKKLDEGAPLTLVDSRPKERKYDKGHIPGAINRFFRDNLEADGRFKAPAQLRAEWLARLAGIAPERVVHQCGSGVSACHNQLAMAVAGLSGSRLYAGSWSEWCADAARPVAR